MTKSRFDEHQALLGCGSGRSPTVSTAPFTHRRFPARLPLRGEFFEQLTEVCAGDPGQGRM
ncbi:hypothetical protein [Streptomyces coeruleorubidus]|uniref:hypothetical protein n=1 Tax=Streptomyces coeruleorubidus TaxID=116188 RepID=UPI0036745E15